MKISVYAAIAGCVGCSCQPHETISSLPAFAFFKWALENGQKEASALDYVPLPQTLVKQIEDYWTASFKG